MFVFSDDEHDRMRIMAPVGELRELEADVLQVLLQANYDRALDARYALRGMEVWSVAVHPLATLATDDFAEPVRPGGDAGQEHRHHLRVDRPGVPFIPATRS